MPKTDPSVFDQRSRTVCRAARRRRVLVGAAEDRQAVEEVRTQGALLERRGRGVRLFEMPESIWESVVFGGGTLARMGKEGIEQGVFEIPESICSK